MNLNYVPGTKVCIGDMLSRAHPSSPPSDNNQDEEKEPRIFSFVAGLPISENKLTLLKQAAAAEEGMQMIQGLN